MGKDKREKFQVSAGGVVVRAKGGGPEVCLILRYRKEKATWCLPKGHLEASEDSAAAAVREVREETGIEARIVDPLSSIVYRFMQPGDKIRYSKRVDFFLMDALTDAIDPQDLTEVSDAKWVPIDEAIKITRYPKERQVLRAARKRLAKQGESAENGWHDTYP